MKKKARKTAPKTYNLKVMYDDGGKYDHRIVETWEGLPKKALLRTLVEVQDLFIEPDCEPVEPTLEGVTERLGEYIPEKDCRTEYERMKREWQDYCVILDSLAEGHEFVDVCHRDRKISVEQKD